MVTGADFLGYFKITHVKQKLKAIASFFGVARFLLDLTTWKLRREAVWMVGQ